MTTKETVPLTTPAGESPLRPDAERHLADSIVYLCTLLTDRPRRIDRYIDYFGETPPSTRDADTGPRGQAPGRTEDRDFRRVIGRLRNNIMTRDDRRRHPECSIQRSTAGRRPSDSRSQ